MCGPVVAADDKITITHNVIDHVYTGDPINISATINDPSSDVDMVRAYFKTTTEDRYYFVAMSKNLDNNMYTGTIPAALAGTASVEYVILARDMSDQVVKTQHYIVEVEDKKIIARLN